MSPPIENVNLKIGYITATATNNKHNSFVFLQSLRKAKWSVCVWLIININQRIGWISKLIFCALLLSYMLPKISHVNHNDNDNIFLFHLKKQNEVGGGRDFWYTQISNNVSLHNVHYVHQHTITSVLHNLSLSLSHSHIHTVTHPHSGTHTHMHTVTVSLSPRFI